MSTDAAAGMELIQPEGWPRPAGYANGVAARGRHIFLAGQVGWNPRTNAFETDGFAGQVRQALHNIAAVLHAAGAEPRHVVRLSWFITDRDGYTAARPEIGRAYREVFGRHYPAMSVVVVAGLLEDGALVEVEATAVVP